MKDCEDLSCYRCGKVLDNNQEDCPECGPSIRTEVTKKPSELKPGSKDAKRRKSFCARMSGMPGPLKKPNGEPTRKKLALDKWNC
jgi:hypothetical protein